MSVSAGRPGRMAYTAPARRRGAPRPRPRRKHILRRGRGRAGGAPSGPDSGQARRASPAGCGHYRTYQAAGRGAALWGQWVNGGEAVLTFRGAGHARARGGAPPPASGPRRATPARTGPAAERRRTGLAGAPGGAANNVERAGRRVGVARGGGGRDGDQGGECRGAPGAARRRVWRLRPADESRAALGRPLKRTGQRDATHGAGGTRPAARGRRGRAAPPRPPPRGSGAGRPPPRPRAARGPGATTTPHARPQQYGSQGPRGRDRPAPAAISGRRHGRPTRGRGGAGHRERGPGHNKRGGMGSRRGCSCGCGCRGEMNNEGGVRALTCRAAAGRAAAGLGPAAPGRGRVLRGARPRRGDGWLSCAPHGEGAQKRGPLRQLPPQAAGPRPPHGQAAAGLGEGRRERRSGAAPRRAGRGRLSIRGT
jgi:hypothetical protein